MRRAFLVVFGTAAIPLALAAAWFSYQLSGARQTTLQLHREVAGLAATTVARHLDVLEGRLEFLRQFHPELSRSPVPASAASSIQRALRLNPDIIGLAVTDAKGREAARWSNSRLLSGFGELYRVADPALKQAAELGRPAAQLGVLAQAPALVTVQPVPGGRFLLVAVSLEGLWNELSRHRLGSSGMTVLATSDGRLLPLPGRTLPRVEPAFLRRLFESGDRGWSEAIPAPEGLFLGMFERVSSQGLSDWYALTLQPASEAALSTSRVALLMGVLGALAAALALAGSTALSAPVAGGLSDLKAAVDALAKGALKSEPAISGPPELKEVSRLLLEAARRMEERERQIEDRVGEERAKIETMITNIPDGIVMTNLRGEVLYINAPAMQTLGVKPDDVTQAHKGLFELIRQDQLRSSVQNILEKHTRSEVVELPMQGPEGPVSRFFKTTVTLFSTPGAKDFGVLLMMRDVTAERELMQLKEEFLHSVAHDLRAPIFAIQGYLRLVEKNVQPEARVKGYFDAIYQSCEKLTLFIQDILDSARLEAGQLKLGVSTLGPAAFLQRVQRLFGAVAAEKGIGLELALSKDLPEGFDADERLLERVMTNLVSNALKVVPRGGRITLGCSRAGADYLEFSVSDTGPGIPADKRALVFEKFSQLGGEQRRAGFGLGLNICRRIVELHRGQIWVDSEEGRGSQFVFRIPVAQVV